MTLNFDKHKHIAVVASRHLVALSPVTLNPALRQCLKDASQYNTHWHTTYSVTKLTKLQFLYALALVSICRKPIILSIPIAFFVVFLTS